MNESNVQPMKRSSIYATFGNYYGEKLYKLLYDCCQGVGSFCYEVLKCLGISDQGDSSKFLNQQGEWVTINTDGLLRVKVTVTSAEILDAYDTPVELIPAPPAGFYIDPISVMWYLDYQTTPYDTNTKWSLYFESRNILTANNLFRYLTTKDKKYKEQISQSYQVAPTALTFFVEDGNPTAGDSDLIIFITYQLVEL
jgi:hypothetical protein